MGVRGLTTFIKNQEHKYLRNYKLHNCTVLLDGNSIASNLFIWCNTESAFGGDYDKFAKFVKDFFKVLQVCEIKPLVVFDGGYEERKLETVYTRMKHKFKLSQSAQPLTGSLNFPLFMRIVFREVLTELNIPFAQSDFEADDELAALARQLKCPVLSYDSDFYIYDVLYIPFLSLCLEPVTQYEVETDKFITYLDCKIYTVDVLIDNFGGLDKGMLPLLATILGNDYVNRSLFEAFYANLKIPKGKSNTMQRRIKAVIEWLRNETFESAVGKILGRMKKKERKDVMMQMMKVVNGYVDNSSILNEKLGIISCNISHDKENGSSNLIKLIENIDKNITISEKEVDNDSLNEGSANVPSSEDSVEDCIVEDSKIKGRTTFHCSQNKSSTSHCNVPPGWLLEYSRKGKIQSCIMDIVSLKQYFCIPQVEDFSLPSAHSISTKILNATVGLLLETSDLSVKYWSREGSHLNCYFVEPITETASSKFPKVDEVIQMNESIRKSILLEVLDTTVDLNKFPDEWHLFIVSAIFWLKHMKEPVVTERHLFTIILCLVCMYTIDSHVGVHRNKQTFMKKYKTYLNKILENKQKENMDMKESKVLKCTTIENCSPKTELGKVTHEDCVMMFEIILPHHHLSEEIKKQPKKFCLSTVHAFSQFQSCLYHVMVFNSVLGFPFKEAVVSRLFSGSFAYNIYTNLTDRNNVDTFLNTLFEPYPSLFRLFKVLVNVLQSALGGIDLCRKSTKKRRKKKKCTQEDKSEEFKINEIDENDELYTDENNRFSTLSLAK